MLPVNQTAIRVKQPHMGYQVFLGDEQLPGVIEVYRGWGLDILPEGVKDTDDVFVANNAPYARLESAVAAVTAAYLTQSIKEDLPDYF